MTNWWYLVSRTMVEFGRTPSMDTEVTGPVTEQPQTCHILLPIQNDHTKRENTVRVF